MPLGGSTSSGYHRDTRSLTMRGHDSCQAGTCDLASREGHGRLDRHMVGRLARTVSLGALVLVTAVGLAGPASATRVCINFFDGNRCEIFREPTPTAPGNSPGMKMTISPSTLTGTNELKISAGRFTKGEIVRVWVYNIFGQGRMSALTNVHEANAKGRVSITYAPSTALYESSWGAAAMCMRGERSLKLACEPFTVADDGSGSEPTPTPAPSGSSSPGASPTPTPSSSLAPGCVDAGFTILCTN